MILTETEEIELLQLLEQEDLELVSPAIETLRDKSIGGTCPDSVCIKGVRGGRGAGAKSWGLTSLLVQESNYFPHRVAALREQQNSLDESVYELIEKTVDRLRYPGWKFTKSYIESPAGAHWIFKGLHDLRANRNIKGLEGFTRFFVEEAASIVADSWMYMLPTLFRNKGAKLFFCYNPDSEADPVTTEIWNNYKNDSSAILIEARPEGADNPWWNEGLQKLSTKLKAIDPELWEYVYGGKPRIQGFATILNRILIRQAMERNIENPDGGVQVGCDPADMGDDKTEIYIRKGYKIIDHIELRKMDGEYIANEIWNKIKRDPSIPIKVDTTGIGTSTRDNLRRLGAKVIPIHFGNAAFKKDQYINLVTEMWFDFKDILPNIDIPDDLELMSDLSSRKYFYDTKGKQGVESKDNFKKRYNRSPDKGDALLLCFYEGNKLLMSDADRAAMAQRNSR